MEEERIQSLVRYLRPRHLNLLSRAGIWDYSQVEAMSDQQLQTIAGMGPTRVREIRNKIPYVPEAGATAPLPNLNTSPFTHPGTFEGIVDVQDCNGQTASRLLRAGKGWELLGVYPHWRGIPQKDGQPIHVLKTVTYAVGRREA